MELLEAIKNRRSVRRFETGKNVTDEQLKKIIEAGIMAPSSGNSQCWHFIVVRDEGLKTRLSTEAGHQPFINTVPAVIVVCVDFNVSVASYGERGVNTYSLQDTAAAIENMLLTITDLGLATCWVGAFNELGASKVLELPKNLRPVAMLPIGHAAASPKMPKRKPLEDVVEWR